MKLPSEMEVARHYEVPEKRIVRFIWKVCLILNSARICVWDVNYKKNSSSSTRRKCFVCKQIGRMPFIGTSRMEKDIRGMIALDYAGCTLHLKLAFQFAIFFFKFTRWKNRPSQTLRTCFNITVLEMNHIGKKSHYIYIPYIIISLPFSEYRI